MTPNERAVAEVVAGLTKAQKESLVHAIPQGIKQELRAYGCGPVTKNVAKAGCVDGIWHRLTPLGLAARKHLLAKEVGK